MFVPTSIDEEIILTFFKISRMIRKPSAEASLTELTIVQLQALIAIGSEKHTVTEVAEELGVTLPTTTVLLDKLVKMKLVDRKTDRADRRITRLALTKKGRQLLDNLMKQKVVCMKSILSSVPEPDKKELLRIFNSLFTRLEQDPAHHDY